MLILVGVTVTVALNGNLFGTTQKAATDTNKEVERERLTEIAVANYNALEGKITNANDLEGKIRNSLGFEKSDKTTESKLVVQGKTGTLWQIDLDTAEVSEYIDIYRIAYEDYEYEEMGLITSYYLLEGGVFLTCINDGIFSAYNFTMNGIRVELSGKNLSCEFTPDRKSLKFDGKVGERNSTKKFSYNCEKDETLGIYKNAFYLNNEAQCPLFLYYNENGENGFSTGYWLTYNFDDLGYAVDFKGITTNDELKKKLAEYNMSISDDGTEITYNGKIYKLMDK